MRVSFALLALSLIGCAAPPPPLVPTTVYSGPLSPEAEAARRQHDAAAQAFLDLQARMSTGSRPDPAFFEARAAEQATETRNRQAAVICRARGNLAATQPAFGGFGVTGGIAAGMQQAWAGGNAEAICLETYRATGIMPAY